MTKLINDLTKAFTSESMANRIYLDFARKAESEGNKEVAKLFRAAAEAEGIHAHNHLRSIGIVKSTKDNLQTAANGEVNECKMQYPSMINNADAAGDNWARKSFHYANETERIGANIFQQTFETFGTNKEEDYYVCKVCGLIVKDEVPEKCPVCGSRKKVFKKID
jgi:rubrerythrin